MTAMTMERRATTGALAMAQRTWGASRTPPADFERTFIELGREQCAVHYRCRRSTINAWLEQSGRARLVELRAAHVRAIREQGLAIKNSTIGPSIIARYQPRTINPERIRDDRFVTPALARQAAQFLRCVRNGGWIVSIASNGDWWVGSRRRSPADMVDFAVSKGFDRKSADLQTTPDGE